MQDKNQKRVGFLTLPSLNLEIFFKQNGIPEAIKGRKVTVDELFFYSYGENRCFNVRKGDYKKRFSVKLEEMKIIAAGSSINTAVALEKLGQNITITGAISDDVPGYLLQKNLVGKKTVFFPRSSGTALSVVIVDPDTGDGTNLCYKPPYDIDVDAVMAQLVEIEASYVVATGVRLSEVDLVEALFKRKNSHRVLMPNKELLREEGQIGLKKLLRLADILQVNEEEASLILERQFEWPVNGEDLFDLAPIVIVTQGEKGSVLTCRDKKQLLYKEAVKVDNVVDSTGAGDAFLAAFLYAHSRGKYLELCQILGNWFGSEQVQVMGGHGGTPSLEKLKKFCS